jgi:hypothetical protein
LTSAPKSRDSTVAPTGHPRPIHNRERRIGLLALCRAKTVRTDSGQRHPREVISGNR